MKTETQLTKQDSYFDHEALSRSDLKDILTSPKYFHNLKTGVIEHKQSSQMDFGTAVHMAILEPEKFNSTYQVLEVVSIPDDRVQEIKGRCQWQLIDQYNGFSFFAQPETDATLATMAERIGKLYPNKQILLPSQWNKIRGMISALQDNPIVNNNLQGDISTEQMFTGEIDGVAVKCKLDIWNKTTGTIIDFKTSDRPIAPASFAWEVKKWALDIQAYLYQEIMRQNGHEVSFKFIVQNKSSYEAIVLNPSLDVIAQGMNRAKLAIGIYKYCKEHDSWSEYLDGYGNSNSTSEFTLELPKGEND